MGLKAGLQILQQTGKAVANYADDAARLVAKNGDDVARAISSTSDDVARYAKACGKRSILETKPSIFHGINPTLTYEATGKTFALPRFISQEMQQARKLNQIAIRQIKQPVNPSFPKAIVEDLRRLTSNAIEDSYSRVQWANLRDGKIYNLLKQGETADGKNIIRILDQDGALVKEVAIKPKEIGIIDNFGFMPKGEIYPEVLASPYGRPYGHGEIVRIFAQRNNPFANYTYIDIGHAVCSNDPIRISEAIKSSELLKKKYDFLSISMGSEYNLENARTLSEQIGILKQKRPQMNVFDQFIATSSKDTRVLVAAGNGGKNRATGLYQGNIEHVGALSPQGTLSKFSASRNSYFTQHYELGEYGKKLVYNSEGQAIGVNITGVPGSDLRIKLPKGKSPSDVYLWEIPLECYSGTSFSTPTRAAKLALNDMMEGVL